MKIGIITLWKTQDNYGGVLQNFALQTYLLKRGHEPHLIRYYPKSFLINLKRLVKRILGYPEVKFITEGQKSAYLNRGFDQFRQQYMSISDKLYTSNQKLCNDQHIADCFITGSDQVWNYNTFDSSGYPFFLKFVPDDKFKIAYAASFGSIRVKPAFLNYIRPLLKRIDKISVREEQGIGICAQADRQDARLVCDPTLLLQKQDYLKLIKKTSLTAPPSLFCYILGWESEIPVDAIMKFTSSKKLSFQWTPSQGMTEEFFKTKPSFFNIPDWLKAIDQASLFCTNSFHGAVLAIIMETDFIVFPLKGKKGKMNSRIHTLLESVRLMDRIYESEEKTSFKNIASTPIDWPAVKDKLSKYSASGKQFLAECGF